MPESKQISTFTVATAIINAISIITYYFDNIGSVLSAFISSNVRTVQGINFIEGEGGIITVDNTTDFYLDSNGNLIVDGPNAANYSLDQQTGQLQYNY